MDKLIKKDGERKTVVIGLSGGTSSSIAAYLLKIQKYDLIGVTILQKSNSGTKCFISDVDIKKIKDFCLRLNIPHHTVDAEEEFTEKVQNVWLSKRIEVLPWPSSCSPCHEFRMKILYQKMLEFNATHISTGHFAKIFNGEQGVTVHSTHDLSLDQSPILHSLDSKILSSLLLPLSSLGAVEMEKLIQNFSLKPLASQVAKCFEGKSQSLLLETFSHFNASGEIMTGEGEKVGSHEGELQQYVGKEIISNGQRYYIRGRKAGTHNLLAEEKTLFLKHEIKLSNVLWSQEVDRSKPFVAFLNSEIQSIKVHVYPKTLNRVWIKLSEPYKFTEGEELALYMKKGGSSKLILTGIIQFSDGPKSEEEEALEFVF